MIVVMPVETKEGMKSRICPHFGRTPFWAIYDTVQKELDIKEKISLRSGGGCNRVEEIMQFEPDIVFVIDMGFRAKQIFEQEGITVKTGNFDTVEDVIENTKKLKDFDEACTDRRHR